MLNDLLFRLRAILRRDKMERDLDEELRFHFERQVDAYLGQGRSPEEARRRARLAVGGVEQVKEECRDARGTALFETLVQDLRYAARMFRKNPGFTAVVVLTLALGIGANSALFSIIENVVLKPLPYADPDRLVQVWEDPSGRGEGRNSVSARMFASWKEQTTMFENISAIRSLALNLTGEGSPERLRGLQVSAGYLDIFRVSPALGRGFLPEEDQAGKDGVVILTNGLWQGKFGGDRNLIGRSIRLGNKSRTVIGVLPPGCPLPYEPEFLVPFVYGSEPWHQSFRDHRLRVIARTRPAATLPQAREEMKLITDRLRPALPEFMKDWGAVVVPMREELTGEIRRQLLVLFGATAFVLLIACANVANLLLARASSRRREIGIRVALGAGRRRVLRQFLTESVMLSLFGGAVGFLLALWGIGTFNHWRPASLPPGLEIGLDFMVLGFAFLLSVFTGLAFGLAPAVQFARSNLEELKGAGRTSSGTAGRGIRRTLIVAEIALAFTLLAGAGLLFESMLRLQAVPLGFEPQGVLAMDISLEDRYPAGERRVSFYREVLRQIESLPGVDAAGMATTLPMAGSTDNFISVEGRPNQYESGASTDYDFVAGNYFRAMRIRLARGRVFSERDDSVKAQRAVILNNSLAQMLFAAEDPLGRQVRFVGEKWEVVGIVADVQQRGLDRHATNHVYLPQAFSPFSGSLVIRTKVDPSSLTEGIRRKIFTIDPDQPVSNIRTLEQIVASSVVDRRSMLMVLGLFSTTALVLAAIGLYGVIAFSVTERSQEIGVRMALGATRLGILTMVLGEGIRLTGIGAITGLLGALAVTRVLSHLLFRVTPTDPITLSSVTLVLVAVALFACYLPARRATEVDPMVALRCE